MIEIKFQPGAVATMDELHGLLQQAKECGKVKVWLSVAVRAPVLPIIFRPKTRLVVQCLCALQCPWDGPEPERHYIEKLQLHPTLPIGNAGWFIFPNYWFAYAHALRNRATA